MDVGWNREGLRNTKPRLKTKQKFKKEQNKKVVSISQFTRKIKYGHYTLHW